MSRLQQKNILNQKRLFTRILSYSLIGHLALSMLLLFNNSQQSYKLCLTATAIDTNIPIVFVSQSKPRSSCASGGAGTSIQTVPASTVPAFKRGTTLVQEKLAASKKGKQSAKQTKKTKAKDTKKSVIQKKQASKSVENKKTEEPKKELEKPVAAPIQNLLPPVAGAVADANAKNVPMPDENVLYVTQQEFDELQKEENLRNEVSHCWQCPPGLSDDLSCVVKISIDHEGAVADVSIDSSSGVLIFDTSARMALSTFTPPAWAYGKSLLITFKQ